ncbi:MAG: hypothetical protein JW776_10070 [Candidatus Lokiarchaeota archaeon]|nr:hypothetical protein [Candidatus Lokiarchaeota archaeon]
MQNVRSIEDILELDVGLLRGIDPINTEKLKENGLHTISDLAQVITPPKIQDLPESVMDKWIRTAMMLLQFATSSQEKKILLLGLDAAGKTSILQILQRKHSTIRNLLPTRGVSRQTMDFLGTSMICWDFGGQEAYRKMYLARPDLFLESDLIIFVIDVLDSNRYDESLDYLFEIMRLVNEMGDKPPLIVSMHKFDPDVQDDEELLRKRANLIDTIATKALDLQYNCKFVNSTIYLRETVEQLFSIAIQEMHTATYMLEKLVQEYSEKINAKALALMTNNSLVLATYSMEPILENIITQTGLIMQALVDFYKHTGGLKLETDYSMEFTANQLTMKTTKLFPYQDDDLLLWAVFSGDGKKEFADVEWLRDELKPIIQML